MLIHNQIRKEVIALIEERLPEVKGLHNGRVFFTDPKMQLPALSVYIEGAECEPVSIGHTHWESRLVIAIYIPFYSSEEKLDLLIEKIHNIISKHTYKNIDQVSPGYSFEYEYDFDNHVWLSGTLTYSIKYDFKEY
ncbi:TPA: phage tail protein [Pasteurella multocida]|nr:phage tail protein [Pasteurella multocida]HDR0752657.1 phage tail protein [Pasteurella multocida]HDR0786395.1 phage tail protein [Pasteurella multocida]HDR0788510.1 phage tail protein [Pasteurella multocida]HDR0790918.1 phage tail protein [Pasteurella multocida]